MKDFAKISDFVAHGVRTNAVSIGQNSGRVMVSGGEDHKVNVWAIGKSSAIMSLSGHTSPVECVSFDRNEEMVVAGSASGALKIWDLQHGKVVRILLGHKSNCTVAVCHPFGDYFASGSLDCTVKIWDQRRRGCLQTYRGHRSPVTAVSFSPDGRWLLSGDETGHLMVWDLTQGKMVSALAGHAKGAAVSSVTFHPTELIAATGGADRVVRTWALDSFAPLTVSPKEATPIQTLRYSEDGTLLFTGSTDSLRVLDADATTYLASYTPSWGVPMSFSTETSTLITASVKQTSVYVHSTDLRRFRSAHSASEGEDEGEGEGLFPHVPSDDESSSPPIQRSVSVENAYEEEKKQTEKREKEKEHEREIEHQRFKMEQLKILEEMEAENRLKKQQHQQHSPPPPPSSSPPPPNTTTPAGSDDQAARARREKMREVKQRQEEELQAAREGKASSGLFIVDSETSHLVCGHSPPTSADKPSSPPLSSVAGDAQSVPARTLTRTPPQVVSTSPDQPAPDLPVTVANIVSQTSAGHSACAGALMTQLTTLRAAAAFWRKNDPRGAFSSLPTHPHGDSAVAPALVDILAKLTANSTPGLTLSSALVLCASLLSLFSSPSLNPQFLRVACSGVLLVTDAFGALVRQTLTAETSAGIDVSFEERREKCTRLLKTLVEISRLVDVKLKDLSFNSTLASQFLRVKTSLMPLVQLHNER